MTQKKDNLYLSKCISSSNEINLEEQTSNFAELIKREILGVKSVNMALKSSEVIMRQFKFPKMTNKELDRAVYFEAKNNMVISENSIYDWSKLEGSFEDENEQRVLLVATNVDLRERYQNIAKNSGFFLNSLEVDILSIYRLVKFNGLLSANNEELNMIFYMEEESTSLLLAIGRKYLLSRNISIGRKFFEQEIAFELGVEASEAGKLAKEYCFLKDFKVIELGQSLIGELEKTVGYVINQGNFFSTRGNLFFVGKGFQIKGLFEFLNKEFSLTPLIVDPFKKINSNKKSCFVEDISKMYVATGLALKGGRKNGNQN